MQKVVAFPELGMEAIYEFDVEDMPVSVAVDAAGTSGAPDCSQIWHDKIIAAKSVPRQSGEELWSSSFFIIIEYNLVVFGLLGHRVAGIMEHTYRLVISCPDR